MMDRMSSLPVRFDVVVHPAPELRGDVQAQPSKNYTTRFLLAAALGTSPTVVRGVARSEDAAALTRCLRDLGARLEERGEDVHVTGFGARPAAGRTLDVGNAGAVLRFLIGVSALTRDTTFTTTYHHSLGTRPQGDLLATLRQLGADVTDDAGRLPITLSGPVRGGEAEVSAERSSQYASALLFAAPLLPGGLDLHLTGHIKSHAPLRQTLHTLRVFGIEAHAEPDLRRVRIPGGQTYHAPDLSVPGDYPGSAALLAAAALAPGEVRLRGLHPDDLQGEREAVDVLRGMGADLTHDGDVVTVRGGRPLRAVTRDGDGFTDAVQALSAAAAYAEGTTTWHNVATLRLKECDRISDTRRELQALGLTADETEDSLSVTGRPHVAGGLTVSGHGDHRMIMMLTACGLRADAPVTITGAHHVRKSYPEFFRHLEMLGARFEYRPTTEG